MQEMCGDWYKYLLPQIKDDYEVVEPRNSVFTENRSAIIYNKTRLTLWTAISENIAKATKTVAELLRREYLKERATAKYF